MLADVTFSLTEDKQFMQDNLSNVVSCVAVLRQDMELTQAKNAAEEADMRSQVTALRRDMEASNVGQVTGMPAQLSDLLLELKREVEDLQANSRSAGQKTDVSAQLSDLREEVQDIEAHSRTATAEMTEMAAQLLELRREVEEVKSRRTEERVVEVMAVPRHAEVSRQGTSRGQDALGWCVIDELQHESCDLGRDEDQRLSRPGSVLSDGFAGAHRNDLANHIEGFLQNVDQVEGRLASGILQQSPVGQLPIEKRSYGASNTGSRANRRPSYPVGPGRNSRTPSPGQASAVVRQQSASKKSPRGSKPMTPRHNTPQTSRHPTPTPVAAAARRYNGPAPTAIARSPEAVQPGSVSKLTRASLSDRSTPRSSPMSSPVSPTMAERSISAQRSKQAPSATMGGKVERPMQFGASPRAAYQSQRTVI